MNSLKNEKFIIVKAKAGVVAFDSDCPTLQTKGGYMGKTGLNYVRRR